MTDPWAAYHLRVLGDRGLLDYAVEHWSYNLPLYQRIRLHVPTPARILEIGCGLGLSAVYLQEVGYQVTGIDNNLEALERAKGVVDFFRSKVVIEKGEATDLSRYYGRFDLAFSLGLIEHFEREVAIQILQGKAQCARYVLAAVPSIHSRRLLPECEVDWITYRISSLRALFRQAGLREIRSFGFGDVTSPLHIAIKRLLPYGLYRLLQNRFSYVMGLSCLGRSGSVDDQLHG